MDKDRKRRVATSLYNSGMSYADVAIFMGISRQRVHQLVKQPTYKPVKKTLNLKQSPLVEFYIWLSSRIQEAAAYGLPVEYRYALKDTIKVLMAKEPLLALVSPASTGEEVE